MINIYTIVYFIFNSKNYIISTIVLFWKLTKLYIYYLYIVVCTFLEDDVDSGRNTRVICSFIQCILYSCKQMDVMREIIKTFYKLYVSMYIV